MIGRSSRPAQRELSRVGGYAAATAAVHQEARARRHAISTHTVHEADSRYAHLRLLVTLALMTVGSAGMYVVAVMLPAVQASSPAA